ncbi:MAG TPA: radical SAM protein [Spirochaetia bacterium]|nr:radical SAM protein [Spirochaetia bacterium]
MSTENSVHALNLGLRVFFSEFVRVSLGHPRRAMHFAVMVIHQLKAARVRSRWARKGLHVPPMTIFSVTNRCNLHCKGCYAQAISREAEEELSASEMAGIVRDASELGVSFIIIAGGEPLLRPEVVSLASSFPRVLFLLVTNGLLLDASLIAQLKRQPNTIPVLSIEGNESQTDDRRGEGVHRRLRAKMRELREAGVFFSLSLTVNRINFETVTSPEFVSAAIDSGCMFFLFLEYTPVRAGTEDWVISETQRVEMADRILAFRAKHRAVFVAVPWDEDEVGGCLAAGRGFVHISASGNLEPCPFAPYSDTNLKGTSLKEALRSPFLEHLRSSHDRFEDTSGGCSLWKERDAMKAMVKRSGSE